MQSAPKTTSPMPLSSKNCFGLVKFALNFLNQIEKKSSKLLFGPVCRNVFGTDCYSDSEPTSFCSFSLMLLA